MARHSRLLRPFAILLALALLAALVIPLATRSSRADQQVVTISPGDQLVVRCETGLSGTLQGTEATIECAAPPPTQPPPAAIAIGEIRGVEEGGTIKGKVNIEAVVAGENITAVVFQLQRDGQNVLSHTERRAPYFFLGDNNGAPNGWDTAQQPDGAYMLNVTATNAAGQSATAMAHFAIANGAPPPPPPATATPVPPPPPPGGMTGACGESMHEWHPPVVTGPDGKPCATGHEHGDAPPDWIAAAGYQAMFHGHFNTSPKENTDKHAAMKGFTTRMNDVDVYFRIHAASNPLDRSARYHSYEAWARDPSGNVSHWQLWYNSGDPVTSRVLRRKPALPEEAQRPIVLMVDQTSLDQGIGCEQWYAAPGEPSWGWDFGWTICGATTLYQPNENATAGDQSTWKLNPNGTLGGTRRLEAAWYAGRQHPTGAFVSTQFGEIVSGMDDPRCSGTTDKFGTTYQNVCLEQYIAPTMPQVAFPGNAQQKDFDTTGVKIPN